jgi:uncharacterized membrane protein YeaQ/YmgE (transglycosylase-associated protein family)
MKVYVGFLIATFLLSAWSARHGKADRFVVLLGMSVGAALMLFSYRWI